MASFVAPARVRSLAEFISTHDRLPMNSDGNDGRRLRDWLIDLRSALAAEQLDAIDVESFDRTTPGWSLPYLDTPQSGSRAVTFHRRTILAAEHFDLHGRLPTKTDKDADIARLGEWLRQMRGASRRRNNSFVSPERIALLDRLIPGWDTTKSEVWIARARDIETFIDEHGRFPGEGASRSEERRMHSWLYHNAQAIFGERRGGAEWQRRYLDRHLPGWAEKPKQKYNSYWIDRLDAAIAYVSEHGRLPTGHVEGSDAALLTAWLAQNRRDRTSDAGARGAILDEKLPGWRAAKPTREFVMTHDGRWNDNIAALRAFLAARGRFPSAGVGASAPERFLRAWLARQRLTATPDRAGHLDAVATGWRDVIPRARPNVPVRGGMEDTTWMAPRLGDIITTGTERLALVTGIALLPGEAVDVQFPSRAGRAKAGSYSIARMRTSQSVRLAGAFAGKSGASQAELRAHVRALLGA